MHHVVPWSQQGRWAPLAIATVLCACHSSGTSAAPTEDAGDAGPTGDAGEIDAQPPTNDAGLIVGCASSGIQWSDFPGCPDLKVAINPSALVGPNGAWAPCPAPHATGCLVQATPPGTHSTLSAIFALAGGTPRRAGTCCELFDPGGGRDPGGCLATAHYVVDPVSDVPVSVVSSQDTLCGGPSAFGDLGAVFAARQAGPPVNGIAPSNASILTSPFVTPPVANARVAGLAFDSIGSLFVGDARVLIAPRDEDAGASVYDPADAGIAPTSLKVAAHGKLAAVHGGWLIATDAGLGLLGDDGTVTTIVPIAAPQRLVSFAADRTNGDALVWTQGNCPPGTGTCTDVGLWTSPYATTAAAATPRKIASLDGASSVTAANAGVIGLFNSSRNVEVRNASDGSGWTLIPYDFGNSSNITAIWADANEVWLDAFTGTDATTTYRVTLASLGATTLKASP